MQLWFYVLATELVEVEMLSPVVQGRVGYADVAVLVELLTGSSDGIVERESES